MYERHTSPQDLEELLNPNASLAQTRTIASHLFACSDCWRKASPTLMQITSSWGAMGPQGRADRDPALRSLIQRFTQEQAYLEERLLAQTVVGELKGLSRKARRDRLAKHSRRSQALIAELLAESRLSSPLEGEEWANLALLVCHQLPDDQFTDRARADLLAETFTELASSRRRSARWTAAREALRLGFESAKRGSQNPTVEGLLLAVEGAIEGDIGDLHRADEVLTQARKNFEAAGERRLAARTVVQLAYVLMDAEPERSLALLQESGFTIPDNDKRLSLLAESTRIDCLITLGHCAEALRRFADLSDLWDQFADPFFQLRRKFMSGRLLEGLGHFEDADSLFNQVIAVDLEQRSTKSLFLDMIYLYGSYVKRGDLGKAMETCQRAIRDLGVLELETDSERQMRQLWNSLGKQAQQGKVSLETLLKARGFIRNQWRVMGGDLLATKESAV